MAFNVPTVGTNMVRLDPLPRERLQPADFGQDQVARGAANLGRSIQQFADDQDEISLRYDTAAVKTKVAEATRAATTIGNAVLASQGLDAVAAKAKAREDFQALRKTYSGSLASKRQQQMFDDAFGRLEFDEFTTYDRHEAKQIAVADQAGAEARLQSSYDLAVARSRSNLEAAAQSLADARVELARANPGMPPEVIAQKYATLESKYHVDVANAILDQDGDTLAAEKYMKDHAGAIADVDETKWWKGNRDTIDEEHADSYYGEALALSAGLERTDRPTIDRDQGEVATANSDPLRGRGRISNTAKQHLARGSDNAIDIAAPAGTPVSPPMSGRVVKAWYDPKGGNSVLIQHPNGTTTGYAHLRNVNVEAGQDVDASTVIGGVGNTGSASHGNHLHYTIRDASGRKVDPQGVAWRETGVTRRVPSSDRVDLQRTYQAIDAVAARNNLSPKQVDRLYARADRDAARNDKLRDRAFDDAAESAEATIDKIEAGGGEFTDLRQLGRAAANLKPSQRSAYRALAERNAKGDALEDDGDTFLDLYELSGNPQTQDQFSRMDLKPLRGSMSKGDYNRLRKTQVDIRNGKGTANDVGVDYGRVDSFIGRFAPQSAGVAVRGTQAQQNAARITRARVAEAVRGQVAVQQDKLGRKLTDDEMAGIVRSNLAAVYLNNDTSTPVPRGALRAGDTFAVSVPKAERAAIYQALRRRYPGRPVTEGDIARVYVQAGGGIR